MIETIGIECMYLISTLLLAGKDADSYLLKAKVDDALTLDRLNRWHRDGWFLAMVICALCVMTNPELWWFIVGYSILIRTSLFDIAFNKWSSLDIRYIGNTAITDKVFRQIFGVNGAVTKSIVFFILLIIFNYLFRGRL